MSSYKIADIIVELNAMIDEKSPLPNKFKTQLEQIIGQLEQIPETTREHLVEHGDSIALHHDD
jgi:hypothetical protein